jgi:hypothetical protein
MKLLRSDFLARFPALVAAGLLAVGARGAETIQTNHPRWSYWPEGPFFPLAVWLQAPANAERYREAGFNTFVGLWKGPTEAQLTALRKAGMRVVCAQNPVALRHLDDPTILGWMHGDEPDNAQELPGSAGWGPPVAPEKIAEDYRKMRLADASRPVLLNLGQGVAWDGWYGRGVRSKHPEDYPRYLEGCDIVSFDIYPAVHDRPEIAGKLWFVAQGVERLVRWSDGKRVVWNCLECTRIGNPDRKPTPHEVRCEAWMSLIHGSKGLIFFVHQFKPTFREAALLDDAEMVRAVTALNRQITELAPVLNAPDAAATAVSANASVPVATLSKRLNGVAYLFSVAMRGASTTATFTFKDVIGDSKVEVIGENRTLSSKNGSYQDRFEPWDVHLYRLLPGPK